MHAGSSRVYIFLRVHAFIAVRATGCLRPILTCQSAVVPVDDFGTDIVIDACNETETNWKFGRTGQNWVIYGTKSRKSEAIAMFRLLGEIA